MQTNSHSAPLSSAYLRKLESLQLRARKNFLGNRHGGHQSLRRGHGLEFSDYRNYEQGDNPRHIDWGLYGRSDRLYVKRFREEQALNTLFLIDGSASMFIPEEDRKWLSACELCLSLIYVALMQSDSVRVVVPGEFISGSSSHASAFPHIQKSLFAVKQSATRTFPEGVTHAASLIRFPGLCVIASDFLAEKKEIFVALDALRAKNLDIHLFQILGPSDLNPFHTHSSYEALDSETGKKIPLHADSQAIFDYERMRKEHEQALRSYAHQYGIFFDTFSTELGAQQYVLERLVGKNLLRGA
jgi:uncharacterized protein (DUF58 family)